MNPVASDPATAQIVFSAMSDAAGRRAVVSARQLQQRRDAQTERRRSDERAITHVRSTAAVNARGTGKAFASSEARIGEPSAQAEATERRRA
jgi:hypothetical protein